MRPVDAESQPVVAGEVWVDPALGDGRLRGGEAGVVRLAQRQAMTVEVHRGEARGIVGHLTVETLEQVAVGFQTAFDGEGFEALPLVRGQPVADLGRDRQERRLGSLPEPVQRGDAGLGLPPVPLPLGLAVGVIGHLGDAGAHGLKRERPIQRLDRPPSTLAQALRAWRQSCSWPRFP